MLGALKVSHLLIPVALTQGDQIGKIMAFGLLFKVLGHFWVKIWFVVGIYRVQKRVM